MRGKRDKPYENEREGGSQKETQLSWINKIGKFKSGQSSSRLEDREGDRGGSCWEWGCVGPPGAWEGPVWSLDLILVAVGSPQGLRQGRDTVLLTNWEDLPGVQTSVDRIHQACKLGWERGINTSSFAEPLPEMWDFLQTQMWETNYSSALTSTCDFVPNRNHRSGFPGGAVVENLPASAGDTGLSPGLGRSHMPRSD